MASAALTLAYVTCFCPERDVKGSMQSMCDMMEAVYGGETPMWPTVKRREKSLLECFFASYSSRHIIF